MKTTQMNRKYTKAIDKRTAYGMEVVIEWWKRMFMGWVEVSDGKITFSCWRMDNAVATYTRNVW